MLTPTTDSAGRHLPGGTVPLDGGVFSPSEAWQRVLAEAKHRPLEVPVTVGRLAHGSLSIYQKRANSPKGAPLYETPKSETLDLLHPALEPLRGLNIHPVLIVSVSNNRVRGHATVMRQRNNKETPADPGALFEGIRKNAAALGWLGMDVFGGSAKNSFDNGVLSLELNNFNFKLAGFLDGKGSIALENDTVSRFIATAKIRVPGLKDPELSLERDPPTGKLKGNVDVELTFKRFRGLLHARYMDGRVEIAGKVPINAEKLSGDVNFLVTDAATARDIALQRLGEAAIKAAAELEGGAKLAPNRPPPRPKGMAVAGWASINYHFNDWLSGTADLVVDSLGDFTVIGEIRPQKSFTLFGPWILDKQIFKLGIQAEYGIPYVGGVGIGVDIALHFISVVGPGLINRIVAPVKYSTDPRVSKDFSISGYLNISAYAALSLAVDAYMVITILSHDIKAGAGIKALAGVRAYVDAGLTFGYREPQPVGERKGEFYFGGHGEFAAQPFLGLEGYLFVALDTPWWSPVSDHRWEWPIGSLEYALPGEFGLGLDIPDYVIGSGKWPQVNTSSVAFDKDKFAADVFDDKLGQKSHGVENKPGKWSTTTKPPPPPPPPPPAPATKQPKTGRQRPGPSKISDPATAAAWKRVMADVQRLAQQSNQRPFGPADIEKACVSLRQKHTSVRAEPKRAGLNWQLHVTIGSSSRDFTLKGRLAEPGDAKAATGGAAGPESTPQPRIVDLDRPFKIGPDAHMLRAHIENSRVAFLMKSDGFADFDNRLAELRMGARPLQESDPDLAERFRAELFKLSRDKKTVGAAANAMTDSIAQRKYVESALDQFRNSLNHVITTYLVPTIGEGAHARVGSSVRLLRIAREPVGATVRKIMQWQNAPVNQYGIEIEPVDYPNVSTFLPYRDYGAGRKWDMTARPPVVAFYTSGSAQQPALCAVTMDWEHRDSGTEASEVPPVIAALMGFDDHWNRRGHLVAKMFGGPGGYTSGNIVPMTFGANHTGSGMPGIENPVRDDLRRNKAVYRYEVTPQFGAPQVPPVRVEVRAKRLYPDQRKPVSVPQADPYVVNNT